MTSLFYVYIVKEMRGKEEGSSSLFMCFVHNILSFFCFEIKLLEIIAIVLMGDIMIIKLKADAMLSLKIKLIFEMNRVSGLQQGI